MRQAIENFIIRSGYCLKNKMKFKAITLKQKFEEATDGWIVADKCEEIADNYAIEFFHWCINNGVQFYDNTSKGNVYTYLSDTKVYTEKEILEIFKEIKKL